MQLYHVKWTQFSSNLSYTSTFIIPLLGFIQIGHTTNGEWKINMLLGVLAWGILSFGGYKLVYFSWKRRHLHSFETNICFECIIFQLLLSVFTLIYLFRMRIDFEDYLLLNICVMLLLPLINLERYLKFFVKFCQQLISIIIIDTKIQTSHNSTDGNTWMGELHVNINNSFNWVIYKATAHRWKCIATRIAHQNKEVKLYSIPRNFFYIYSYFQERLSDFCLF